MQDSTFVLTALALLNEELINDDGFNGYNDDLEGTTRLLDELWGLNAHMPLFSSPEDLVTAWYEQFFANEELCAG